MWGGLAFNVVPALPDVRDGGMVASSRVGGFGICVHTGIILLESPGEPGDSHVPRARESDNGPTQRR
jgi:hypothetical protein